MNLLASAAARPAGFEVPVAPEPRARVLIVDDNMIAGALAVALVERQGLEAEVAADGLQAVAKSTAAAESGRPYRLILMDVQMPNLDGLGATRRLRAAGFGPSELPIVALTANGSPDEVAECLAAGMQGHLSKPVAPQQIEALIGTYIVERRESGAPGVAVARVRGDPLAAQYRTQRDAALALVDELAGQPWRRRADVEQLVELLHRLAGTAGHFGEAELGLAASNLECQLRNATEGDVAETLADYRDRLARLAVSEPY